MKVSDSGSGEGHGGKSVLRWLWALSVAGATGLYFLLPAPWPDFVYSSVGALSVGLVVAGVRFFRPSNPWAWYLIAAGHGMTVLADIAYYLYEPLTGSYPPYPSFIDAVYLGLYPLTVMGLLLLVRSRSPGRDRAALIDALIIATAGGLLAWEFLIAPYASDTALTFQEKIVSIAYPCMDALLLAVAARLVAGAGLRGLSYHLLMSSFVLTLMANAAYGVMILAGSYRPGSLLDSVWLLAYGLVAAAALHPSMRRLSEAAPSAYTKLTRERLAALAIASLTAPVAFGVQSALGNLVHPSVFVVSCVVLFLLVLMRAWGLVREVETKADRLEEQTGRLEKQGRKLTSSLEQRDALENQLKHLAFHDSLTGVANRALFDDRLEHAVSRSNRSNEALTVLFIDLDAFKSVNDRLGHAAGDAVLVEVAGRLEACLRQTDTLARFGGDEFAILIDGDGPPGATAVRSRIEAAMADAVVVGEEALEIRASVGIGTSRPGCTASELLAEADAAMYEAKDPGGARV